MLCDFQRSIERLAHLDDEAATAAIAYEPGSNFHNLVMRDVNVIEITKNVTMFHHTEKASVIVGISKSGYEFPFIVFEELGQVNPSQLASEDTCCLPKIPFGAIVFVFDLDIFRIRFFKRFYLFTVFRVCLDVFCRARRAGGPIGAVLGRIRNVGADVRTNHGPLNIVELFPFGIVLLVAINILSCEFTVQSVVRCALVIQLAIVHEIAACQLFEKVFFGYFFGIGLKVGKDLLYDL